MVDFGDSVYTARRKFWALAGQCFVYNSRGELACYVKQKMFKLREDITVYSDEAMTEPVLGIKARQIIDFAAAYDIVYLPTGEKVGAVKRKGFKSIIRDEWLLMDNEDGVIATLGEASGWGAFASRMINLIPQKYVIRMEAGGEVVARFNQKFSFFTHNFDVEFLSSGQHLDRRLGIGALVLLLLIEGREGV